MDDLPVTTDDGFTESVLTSDGQARSRALGFGRAFYALFYASGAFLSPFLALYFSELGLDGRQIGVLRGIAPLITVVFAPLWGALADATRRDRLIRMIAIVGTWFAVLTLSVTRMYGALVAVVVVYAIFGAPVIPLVDSAVLALLGKEKSRYGQQRLWGAVGWGLSGLVAGMLIERQGLSSAFTGYLVLMTCTGLMAVAIPSAHHRSSRATSALLPEPAGQSDRTAYVSDLRRLLSDKHWLAFLLTVLVGGLFLSLEMNYLMLYMDALGANETLMGIALLVSTISEVPVWALSPYFLRRWGSRRLLTVALVSGVVQSLGFSLLSSAWGVLPLQLLHGLSFSALWAAGVSYATDVAPEGTAATAQAMFGATLMGLSASIGAYAGGLSFDRFGGAATFRITVFSSLIALALLWAAGRRSHCQPGIGVKQ